MGIREPGGKKTKSSPPWCVLPHLEVSRTCLDAWNGQYRRVRAVGRVSQEEDKAEKDDVSFYAAAKAGRVRSFEGQQQMESDKRKL